MHRNPIVLIFPPGWPLAVGGPHLALPVLKGFLERRSADVELIDTNIGSAVFYRQAIRKDDVERACLSESFESLNDVFFGVEDELNRIAARFGGRWEIQGGFVFEGCDLSSSESVCEFSKHKSPFTEYFLTEVVPQVMEAGAATVGISVTVPQQLVPTFEFCRLLRSAGFGGRVVLGGNLITRIGESLLLDWVFDLVDGIITFQGEEALIALSDSSADCTDLSHVPNLVWRNSAGLVSNKTKILDKRDFAPPSFDDLPLDEYWGVNYLPQIASRGCYYGKCSFCAIPYAWGNGGFIGHGGPEQVVESMKTASLQYGIHNFKFADEALHPTTVRKIAELLRAEKSACNFEGYARFEPVWSDRKFLDVVADGGLRKVYLGLELAPGKTRTLLNKADKADAVETLENLRAAGIRAHVFCMFGFPGTGVKEAIDTIEFALDHEQLIDSLDIFPFYYAKHTQVAGVRPMLDPRRDWAVEYDYEPTAPNVLSQQEVAELSRQLEEVVWNRKPFWLHPIYRMYSPWENCASATTPPQLLAA